jgi:dTMP kinase
MQINNKGKFLVIEGADATGKATQVRLLQKYLLKNSFQVKILDFPRYYDNFWGKMVGAYLRGKFGGLYENNPYLSTLPYILDQADSRRQIKYALNKGKFVISNRYVTSQVHQSVKLPYYEREPYFEWLEKAAYSKLKAVKPDLVIVLHVPTEHSSEMNKKKERREYLNGKQEDIAEKDLNHQQKASHEYFNQAQKRENWTLVNCLDDSDNLKPPEEIHKIIIKKLDKREFLDDVKHPEQLLLPNII